MPKRAPHAAPGSNQPFVVGPCTSLQQEKAKLKGRQGNRSTAQYRHPWSYCQTWARKMEPEMCTQGPKGQYSLHNIVPCLLPALMYPKLIHISLCPIGVKYSSFSDKVAHTSRSCILDMEGCLEVRDPLQPFLQPQEGSQIPNACCA